jgi:hypothetical protein
LVGVLRGLRETSPAEELSSTVAGEVAACFCLQRSVDRAAAFLLGLAALIDELPAEEARRPPQN